MAVARQPTALAAPGAEARSCDPLTVDLIWRPQGLSGVDDGPLLNALARGDDRSWHVYVVTRVRVRRVCRGGGCV